MHSRIYIGPPGSGKTTAKERHPGCYIDPEESIGWQHIDTHHNLYPGARNARKGRTILEHELDWPTVWITDVLPRLCAAFALGKEVVTGLVTPSNVELVSRFLYGLRDRTAILLPTRTNHYTFVAQGGVKRPRTWGPALRGWQHTYATRLLLQGLASDLELPIVETLPPPEYVTDRKQGCALREACDEMGVRYIEPFFGTWIELDEQDNLIASCNADTSTEGVVSLTCAGRSKVCQLGVHECGRVRTLVKDVRSVPLFDWIAGDKLEKPVPGTRHAVLFFAGTLAPLHRGHLEALETARLHIQSLGYQVLGGYVSPFSRLKEGRVGDLRPVVGQVHDRSVMVRLGLLRSRWLMADMPVAHVLHATLLDNGTHPAQRIVERLRKNNHIPPNEPITTFWVNGKDAVFDEEFFTAFAQHATRNPLNPLRMAIVDNRPGDDTWSALPPTVHACVERCESNNKEKRSATLVREALMTGDRKSLSELVDVPFVEAYLLGKMHQFETGTIES